MAISGSARQAAAWLAAVVWLVACGGAAPPPASADFVQRDDDTSLPGEARPVRLRVSGPAGQPLEGVEVEFAAGSGSGSVSPALAYSGPDGIALAQWTLGSEASSPQRLQAKVAPLAAVELAVPVAPLGLRVQGLRVFARQEGRCAVDSKSVAVTGPACSQPLRELKLEVRGSRFRSAFGEASALLRCANIEVRLDALLRGIDTPVTLRWRSGGTATAVEAGGATVPAEVVERPFSAGGSLDLEARGCGPDNFHIGDMSIADLAFWAD